MRRVLQKLHCHGIQSSRRVSTSSAHTLPVVNSIISPLERLDVDEFKRLAFQPQQPLLITRGDHHTFDTAVSNTSIPAIQKWFTDRAGGGQLLNQQYLEEFAHIVLPYELVRSESVDNEITFERFHAPLEVFLKASQLSNPPRIYIAQAQLQELPQQLRDDLPTPSIVLKAGKGDVYDANIWMGIPPTYTPLHRDPNPNLFVQIASSKVVRLFRPDTGAAIFREAQERIGRHSSAVFRGDEMMQGPERSVLESAVWNSSDGAEGYETHVRPGDALFIPKGWWHSIKSVGDDITASVNWWFR